jgi:hypothetical protein
MSSPELFVITEFDCTLKDISPLCQGKLQKYKYLYHFKMVGNYVKLWPCVLTFLMLNCYVMLCYVMLFHDIQTTWNEMLNIFDIFSGHKHEWPYYRVGRRLRPGGSRRWSWFEYGRFIDGTDIWSYNSKTRFVNFVM